MRTCDSRLHCQQNDSTGLGDTPPSADPTDIDADARSQIRPKYKFKINRLS